MKRQREEDIGVFPITKRQKTDALSFEYPLGLVFDVWNLIFKGLDNDMYSMLQLSLVNQQFRASFKDKVKDVVVSNLGNPSEYYWDLNRTRPNHKECRPTQYHLYHRSQPTSIILTADLINSLFDSITRTHQEVDLPISEDSDDESFDDNVSSSRESYEQADSVESFEWIAPNACSDSSLPIEDHFKHPFIINAYEVYYYEDSTFVFLQREHMFLLLECTFDQPSETAPKTLKIWSYEWHTRWLISPNVLEHRCLGRVIVHDKLLMIIQPCALIYFFDLENKQCLLPQPLPQTIPNIQTDIIRSDSGTFIRFISDDEYPEELSGDYRPSLDFFIRVSSKHCQHKIVPLY